MISSLLSFNSVLINSRSHVQCHEHSVFHINSKNKQKQNQKYGPVL